MDLATVKPVLAPKAPQKLSISKRNERAKRLNVTAKRGASTGPLAADIGFSYHCNYIETMGKALLKPQAGDQGARGEGGAGWQA